MAKSQTGRIINYFMIVVSSDNEVEEIRLRSIVMGVSTIFT